MWKEGEKYDEEEEKKKSPLCKLYESDTANEAGGREGGERRAAKSTIY